MKKKKKKTYNGGSNDVGLVGTKCISSHKHVMVLASFNKETKVVKGCDRKQKLKYKKVKKKE